MGTVLRKKIVVQQQPGVKGKDGDTPDTSIYFIQGGNAFGAVARVGSTNNSTEILANGIAAIRADAAAVGIFQSAPTARLHIKGAGTSDAAYALKVHDSDNANLLYIRNDGQAKFGAGFTILPGGNSASVTGAFPIFGGFGNTFEAASIGLTADLSIGGMIAFNNSGFSKIYSGGGFDINYKSSGVHYFENGNVGIGISPTAKLHIQGTGITGSSYSLKVQNANGDNLLYISDGTANGGITSVGAWSVDRTGIAGANPFTINKDEGTNLGNTSSAHLVLSSNVSGVGYGTRLLLKNDNASGNSVLRMSATSSTYQVEYVTGAYFGKDLQINLVGNQLFAIADASNIPFIYADAGNKGMAIGHSSPGATLHVKGSGSTSSTRALKVDGGSIAGLFIVDDAGLIGAGINPASTTTNFGRLRLYSSGTANSGLYIDSNAGGAYTGEKIGIEVGGGIWSIGFNAALNAMTSIVSAAGDWLLASGSSASPTIKMYYSSTYPGLGVNVGSAVGAVGHFRLPIAGNPTDKLLLVEANGPVSRLVVQNDGAIGFSKAAPTAKFHFYHDAGDSQTVTTKIDNAIAGAFLINYAGDVRTGLSLFCGDNGTGPAGNATFEVKSDSPTYTARFGSTAKANILTVKFNGIIGVPELPTAAAGLSSGDLYVESAANILANGDKVVGWKV